jgi:hypothetical protein
VPSIPRGKIEIRDWIPRSCQALHPNPFYAKGANGHTSGGALEMRTHTKFWRPVETIQETKVLNGVFNRN